MADVLDDAEVARVLSITARPDDVDFGAAGTMARWTEAGIEVIYCVVTDGDAGGFDESFPRDEMPTLRRAEQVAAAKCVGVHDVRFLGYPDGRVQATLDLRRDLARVIRQVRPDRVVCPSPERNYDRIGIGHPDHRAVGAAALDAVYHGFPRLWVNLLHIDIAGQLGVGVPKLALNRLVMHAAVMLHRGVSSTKPVWRDVRNSSGNSRRFQHVLNPVRWYEAGAIAGGEDEGLEIATVRVAVLAPTFKVGSQLRWNYNLAILPVESGVLFPTGTPSSLELRRDEVLHAGGCAGRVT